MSSPNTPTHGACHDIKLPFTPLFSGSLQEDPVTWIEGYKRIASACRWSHDDMLNVVPAYFCGLAAVWFTGLRNTSSIPNTWAEFLTAFRTRFCDNTRIEIWQNDWLNRWQLSSESVGQYGAAFQELSRRAAGEATFPEKFRVSLFIKGLQPNLAYWIAHLSPNTVEDTIAQATRLEFSNSTTTGLMFHQMQSGPILDSPFVMQNPPQLAATATPAIQYAPDNGIQDPLFAPGPPAAAPSPTRGNDELAALTKKFEDLKVYVANLTNEMGRDRGRGRGRRKDGYSTSRARIICYRCGEQGHYASECQEEPKPYDPKPPPQQVPGYGHQYGAGSAATEPNNIPVSTQLSSPLNGKAVP